MSRFILIPLLTLIISFSAVLEASAQRVFDFDLYTVFASDFRHDMGDDLCRVKGCLKKLPFTSFTTFGKQHFKLLLGRTATIPVPGNSALNVQPRVYYGKDAYIHVWLTGEDRDLSFYDKKNSVSILTGPAFKIKEGDKICLVGPSTRWGTLIFVIHSDVEGLDSRSVTARH